MLADRSRDHWGRLDPDLARRIRPLLGGYEAPPLRDDRDKVERGAVAEESEKGERGSGGGEGEGRVGRRWWRGRKESRAAGGGEGEGRLGQPPLVGEREKVRE